MPRLTIRSIFLIYVPFGCPSSCLTVPPFPSSFSPVFPSLLSFFLIHLLSWQAFSISSFPNLFPLLFLSSLPNISVLLSLPPPFLLSIFLTDLQTIINRPLPSPARKPSKIIWPLRIFIHQRHYQFFEIKPGGGSPPRPSLLASSLQYYQPPAIADGSPTKEVTLSSTRRPGKTPTSIACKICQQS